MKILIVTQYFWPENFKINDLALELKQKGIKTRNDLAEQSVDELTELVDMDEKKAGELIMKAREHWFKEE